MSTWVHRFWAKVDPYGRSPEWDRGLGPCWVWTGGRSSGRGDRAYGTFGADSLRAHRVAYELLVAPLHPGQQVHHRCRNTLCVRPDHLEAVTHEEHVAAHRGDPTRRGYQLPKTHCLRGHELTPENVYIHPKRGNRNCRECQRQRRLEWRARQVRVVN